MKSKSQTARELVTAVEEAQGERKFLQKMLNTNGLVTSGQARYEYRVKLVQVKRKLNKLYAEMMADDNAAN